MFMLDEKQPVCSDVTDPQGEDSTVRTVYDWIESAVWALVFVTLVFSFLFRLVGVDGSSMASTLKHGDRLMLVHSFYTPDYGDIVVVRRDAGDPLIKRVIAMEGDTIAIDLESETVYLNGELLEEPYLDGPTPALFGFTGPYTVPEGTVFVMGDNRSDSMDSRHSNIGAIPLEDIMGEAVFRFWPPSQFGPIK